MTDLQQEVFEDFKSKSGYICTYGFNWVGDLVIIESEVGEDLKLQEVKRSLLANIKRTNYGSDIDPSAEGSETDRSS